MKGDFSRSTFDPHKHYTSVRMQQGRVQLDADWNEQADILLHLIATQLQDLLGPGGTTFTGPGFDITPVAPAEKPADQAQADQPEEPADQAQANQPEEPADQAQSYQPEEPAAPTRTLPDFQIGAGRYYVDGMLCENEAPVLFSRQPDYPEAESLLRKPVDVDHSLVYLDVWQRHITAAEDPAIREVALGDVDTTTRTKTVWQVKLLPLPGYVADGDDGREPGGLRSLPDWQEFVAQASQKGLLKARWDQSRGAVLENHLYRVEIHHADDRRATFKWSRENGSVVFPIEAGKWYPEYLFTWEDVPGNDNKRLLSYLKERLALDSAEGENVRIEKTDNGQAIRIATDGAWAEIMLDEGERTATVTTGDGKRRVLEVRQDNGKRKLYASDSVKLNVEGLERDPYQLQKHDWVEIVDDVTVLNGRPLPLCQVTELDRPNALVTLRVTLRAKQDEIDQIRAEIGVLELRHPLLRRWEAEAKPVVRPENAAGDQGKGWSRLENGIQVAFSATGTYRAGDYWLIPARTGLEDGIEWPQEGGQPLAQAPHGIAHHYAPLALLQFQEGRWSVSPPDEATTFRSLPQITDNFIAVDRQLQKLRETVDAMEQQAHVFEDFRSEAPLEKGDVVCIDRAGLDGLTDPGSLLPVKLASSEDAQMVVGVVWEPVDKERDGNRYRAVLYGRVRCKVAGDVEPGELLVASDVPGHAENGGWYLRPGTMIGKALSSTKLDNGQRTDTVDMLVTLG